MCIKYKINYPISTEKFISILNKSTLGGRRPIEDYDCIKGMIKNSNLMITAWHGRNIVALARSMTDFNFACYLSDLAVDVKYQNRGIGKKLLRLTQEQLGSKCKLILIAAPASNSYYEHLGFSNNQACWILESEKYFVS